MRQRWLGRRLKRKTMSSIWVELCPLPQRFIRAWTPGICECDIICNYSLWGCNQANMRSCWLRMGSNPIKWMGVLIRRRGEDTDKHRGNMVVEDRGRDWSSGSHTPGDAWSHQMLEESRTDISLEPAEGAWPCWHFDLGPLAFSIVRINFSCVKSLSLRRFVMAAIENKYRYK